MQLVILQALGLGAIAAWGSARDSERDRTPAGQASYEARTAAKIDIRGDLKCPMPASNTGRSCTLEIVDRETGQTLRVVASNAAMRLYQDGQTQVVATGTVVGDALRIIAIRAE
jgi:hypothetical protein